MNLTNFILNRKIFTVLLLSTVLMGCEGKKAEVEQTATKNQPADQNSETINKANTIGWFDGSVEAAFASAKENDKPLFLYWGAIWCPPCEEIKQTVFKSPDFIAQTELFIPVYLDGDTERAQVWGDKFAVKGYPTMIVFNPNGEEVTRIPGGIDIERYNSVLASSLQSMVKIEDLLTKAIQHPGLLSADDFTQIAFYSWEQANLSEDIAISPQHLLAWSDLASKKDNEIAASRLYFQALLDYINSETVLPDADKNNLLQRLNSILQSEILVEANFDVSMFWPKEVAQLLLNNTKAIGELQATWTKAMQNLRYSDSLSKAEQLGSWYPQLHLYWLANPEADALPDDVLNEVSKHIQSLDETTKGSARQTVINKAYQVLQAAHLYDESRHILLAEIEKSEQPYYFMSALASLAEKEQKPSEAVIWLERAYKSASGNATQFQWGVEFVDGLVRLQPKNSESIITTTQGLMQHFSDDKTQIFSGRNFRRLNTLLNSIDKWDSSEKVKLEPFKKELVDLCHSTEEDSLAKTNCTTLNLKG